MALRLGRVLAASEPLWASAGSSLVATGRLQLEMMQRPLLHRSTLMMPSAAAGASSSFTRAFGGRSSDVAPLQPIKPPKNMGIRCVVELPGSRVRRVRVW